jgi:hypothetical protein
MPPETIDLKRKPHRKEHNRQRGLRVDVDRDIAATITREAQDRHRRDDEHWRPARNEPPIREDGKHDQHHRRAGEPQQPDQSPLLRVGHGEGNRAAPQHEAIRDHRERDEQHHRVIAPPPEQKRADAARRQRQRKIDEREEDGVALRRHADHRQPLAVDALGVVDEGQNHRRDRK